MMELYHIIKPFKEEDFKTKLEEELGDSQDIELLANKSILEKEISTTEKIIKKN